MPRNPARRVIRSGAPASTLLTGTAYLVSTARHSRTLTYSAMKSMTATKTIIKPTARTGRTGEIVGLDITAYTKLTECPDAPRNEYGCPDDEFFHADAATIEWTEKHFPGRTAGLKAGMVYDFKDLHGFSAGSYSGYSAWRNWLAKVAGFNCASDTWNSGTTGPFVELIHFADNEGFIGPVVSAKLAKDFADHDEKAAKAAKDTHEHWYIEVYREWRKAFDMAADNGAVDFH